MSRNIKKEAWKLAMKDLGVILAYIAAVMAAVAGAVILVSYLGPLGLFICLMLVGGIGFTRGQYKSHLQRLKHKEADHE